MMTWHLHWVSVRNFGFEDSLTSVFGVLAAIDIGVSISGLGEMTVHSWNILKGLKGL